MSKWKQYFKKTVAVVSMAAMLVTATDWSKVSAATQEKDLLITDSFSFSDEEAEADNDELFAGYVQKAFLGDSGISLFSTENNTKNLNDDEKSIYAALKTAVAEIAAGTRASTEITLDDWSMSFSYVDLGLDASADITAVKAAVKIAFANSISINKILSSLLADCPYELYWFDKTEGTFWGYSISADGSQCTLSSLCISMPVASAYAYDTYKTDTTKTGATSIAVANARAIVTENEGKSDYEKLVAYRDKICELVSYDHDAANNEDTPYGDPWQLIYVFDNDSNTNVVCEGYAKAFQYLCELSEFDGDVICYTISGYMLGGSHMWNHVTIGGKNYLVDVTNCDAGAIGVPDKLFLKGMTGDISSGYEKTISSKTITYTFKNQTKEMFGTDDDSILNLSAEDYVETVDAVRSVSVTSSASSLTWHDKDSRATLTATPTLATGVTETPTYQWYTVSDDNTETLISGATNTTYTMESGLPAGTYTYRVYVSIGDCKKSADVSVTVKPLVLTKDQLEFTSDAITKKYDGTTSSTATVQIKAGVVADEAVRIEGTAEYNSPNVSEANMVTFTPTAITTGNYRLAATETIEHLATIAKKSRTDTPGLPEAKEITETKITLKEVQGCEYAIEVDSKPAWQDSPTFSGLEPAKAYTLYQRFKGDDNIEPSASSEKVFETSKLNLSNAVISLTESVIEYNGQNQRPYVEVVLNGVKVDSNMYTVSYENNKNAGTAKVKVSANDNKYTGSKEKKFTIEKKKLIPSIEGTTSKTYDGNTTSDGTGLSINLDGIIMGDDVTATATYAYDNVTVGTGKTITVSGITLSGVQSPNYELSSTTLQALSAGIINKAPATITVNTDSYDKVYKDAEFALSDVSYTGDGTLTYTVTDSKYLSIDSSGNPTEQSVENDKVITVSADGKVTIVGSGSAKIKITATEGTNYNAVEDVDAKSITVTVAKAPSAPNKPDTTMEVEYAKEKVSDITTLPEGWAWKDADKDKALTVGAPETATAVYTGADKGNYEVESVEISITRQECTHATTEIRDAVEANNTIKGYTGDTPKLPKKGDVVKDEKGVAKYEILDTAKKEVAYKKPVSKKAKTVTIPTTVKINGVTYKVTQIADNAFANNKKITKVTIGSNVTTIGKKAFYGCKKLKTITIKTTKLTGKRVGSKAFKGIYAKATIKVPKSKLTSYKKLLKARGIGKKAKIKK